MADGPNPDEPEHPSADGYELERPNDYRWTELAYQALLSGTLKAQIAGVAGSRRVTVDGAGPRCGHELNFDQLLDAVAGEDGGLKPLKLDAAVPAPTYLELAVSCRCGEAHAKRPDGVTFGCGINFRVDMLAE